MYIVQNITEMYIEKLPVVSANYPRYSAYPLVKKCEGQFKERKKWHKWSVQLC